MSTRHARTADKTTNDKHTRILKALLQKPENRFCVDCRKKDPRWASFNLGCFMCIRCSGVHRSMGTHISKVKSVDLDSWTVDQVENMIKWGNEKSNMYWEARLSESSIPNESTSGIDPWIRSKYEHKVFVKKGPFPDPSELGPIDEAMLMQLYGKTEANSRTQAHMDRSKESSGSFGTIAPPPSNPTRSSFPKKPTSSSGVQGADLFAIGQGSSSTKAPAQVDFFGLNDPVPAPSAQQAQKPSSTNQSATQDLFSMTAPSPTPSTPATTSQPSTPKPGNTDWKNSIMSLYGNQSSAPKTNNPSGFGQLQGMDAFGFGQAPAQQQQQQQQQQQHNPWGNDDGFGAMQHASGPSASNSGFGAFTSTTSNSNSNSNGFGNNGFSNNGFSNGSSQGHAFHQGSGFNQGNGSSGQGSNFNQTGSGMPQGGDFFSMIAGASRTPVASPPPSNNKNNRPSLAALEPMHTPRQPSLETLPLECIQRILENLSDDCRALYGLLLMNRSWFQMVLPFLYKSPMALIDATWPKLLPYAQVLKKEPPFQAPVASNRPSTPADDVRQGPAAMPTDEAQDRQQAGVRSGRSTSSTRRTSTASSSSGYGYGYAPRTHSRSSSHSSTRSIPGEAFHQGRNDALAQKEQREKLVKRKKMQVLWLLLNCTISEEEHQAHASALAPIPTADCPDSSSRQSHIKDGPYSNNSEIGASKHSSSLLALDPDPNLDIDTTFFRPVVDYLSYYTHHYHPGLRLSIWRLFPSIEDDFTIEWRLINHSPGRIRELFMETVQLQDLLPLAAKLETLQRIRTCHEAWDVPGSMEFMSMHNQLFGTVRMLEFAAYLPDRYDTAMNDDIGQLISQVDHLTVLELSGFEMLRTQLSLIPRMHLKVLRLKCGKSNPEILPSTTSHRYTDLAENSAQNPEEGKISMASFLSQCRQLEELLLRPVDEDLLEWAVQERREFQADSLLAAPNSASSSPALAHDPKPTMVPLRTIELFGEENEHIATTICHAAEAFQDTLEVIKVNGHSYIANRTFKSLSWRCMLPRLKVLKIVGRSNLPFDLQSLRYCPALTTLDLSKYSGMRACSEALLLNLKYLTKLEYLGLSSFDHLTDSTLRTILGCMPRLKHLRLAIGDSAASTLASSSSLASPSTLPTGGGSGPGRGNASIRTSSILSGGSGTSPGSSGTSGTDVSSTVGSGGVEMSFRSPFAALSLNSSSAASFSTVSPASSSMTTSPTPTVPSLQQQQQQQQQHQHQQQPQQLSLGSTNVGSHHHTPPPPPISTVPSSSASTYHPYMSAGASFSGSAYDLASSARSTSSLMERFHQENNYLSLEGILDAIDGLSECKNQLEKLSIVLGKLDFEEHYHRLEQYNVLHQDLEIAVYRYPHSV
ncbi:hypothetical protein BGZ67_004207 [Mortierella alpina]|nr:hypothetical protein BGZ67_004207 [Mortierella alpina]